MTKYIWDKTKPEGERWVPKEEYYANRGPKETLNVVPDIAEFRSPMDGKLVGSRSALREHEKKHGVKQCGELTQASDFDNRAVSRAKTEEAQRRKLHGRY